MERFKRQSDIVLPGMLSLPISLIGAGGIGSWTALTLAKMGARNIVVYDNDKVEDHNVASQFFKEDQLGMNKVDALKINVLEQSGVEMDVTTNIKEEEHINTGFIIVAIDSMEERIRLGNIWRDKNMMIIDGRMGGLQLEAYCVHASRYLATTVPPGDVEPDACTARSISFNCLAIASFIANFVRIGVTTDPIPEMMLCYDFVSNSFLKKSY